MKESLSAWNRQPHSPERQGALMPDIETEQRELIALLRSNYNRVRDLNRDDIYSNEALYDAYNRVDDELKRLGRIAHEYLRLGEYSNVIDIGREVLEVFGIPGAGQASSQSASSAVAITEAINLAAKTHAEGCYALKPDMIVAAWKLGADFGIGDDDAYFLGTPSVGVASFHDPGDVVGYLVLQVLNEQIPIWESPWSGVTRQEDAHDILHDLNTGGSLVEQYVQATSTEDMRQIREVYMRNNKATATSKMADLLSRLDKSHPQ